MLVIELVETMTRMAGYQINQEKMFRSSFSVNDRRVKLFSRVHVHLTLCMYKGWS